MPCLCAQDMYAVGNGAPIVDDSNDVELVDGHENSTHTVFTFRRPLRSCDTEHDLRLGVSVHCPLSAILVSANVDANRNA